MVRLKQEMSSQLVTIAWDRSMESARRLMEKHSIRHLPVTNAEGEIYAMLTHVDLARAKDPDHCVVSNFVTGPLPVADEGLSLGEVAERMLTDKSSGVLVTRGAHALGIVTTDDILRAFVKLSKQEGSGVGRLLPLVGELFRELSTAGI